MSIKKKIFSMAGEIRHTMEEVWYLLRQNWLPVLLFSVVFNGLYLFLVISMTDFALWLNTRLIGVRYISPAMLKSLLMSPPMILTALLWGIGMGFTMVFQIGGLTHAFSMSQIGKKTSFKGLVAAGAEGCLQYLKPRNWLMIPLLLVLMPLTGYMALASSCMYVAIPEFIRDAIAQNMLYGLLLLLVMALLYLIIFAGLFSPLIFLVYGVPFCEAYRKSARLARKHWKQTLLSVFAMNVMLFVVSTSVAAVIARVYSEASASLLDVGLLTSAVSLGNKLYIICDLFRAFFAPICNNALLTTLFFQYHERENSLSDLSYRAFRDKKINTRVLVAVGCVILMLSAYNLRAYGDEIRDIWAVHPAPQIVAHRGDSVRAPENTMPAFELALLERPDWIEFDVHQTKDGVIIVSHDDDLSRVARQKIYVHEKTYEELMTYDVGSWFGEEFSDVRLATLDQALKLFKDKYKVQIEIKPSGYDNDLEEHVLQVIYDNGMQDQCVITCLQEEPLRRIKELDPNMITVYSMFFAWGHIEDMEFSDYFTVEEGNVTRSLVRNVHEAGKQIFAWTVNTEDNVQYLVDCGVDGILTDDPIMLGDALDKVDHSGGLSRAMRFVAAWVLEGI